MEIQYIKPTFTVKENSSLTIACNATGQPVPRVEWAYPTTVEEGLLIKGSILHFDRIQPHHQGNYTCFAQQYNVVYRSEQNRVAVDTKTEFQHVEIIIDQGMCTMCERSFNTSCDLHFLSLTLLQGYPKLANRI